MAGFSDAVSMYDGKHMDVLMINALFHSLHNIFHTMVGLEIEAGTPEAKPDQMARGEVSALIGMEAENVHGSIALTLNRASVGEIFRRLEGEEIVDFDKEASDLAGELVNMLAGGAKRILAEKGFDFDMQSPRMMVGENHKIEHHYQGQTVLLPICVGQSEFFMELNFV